MTPGPILVIVGARTTPRRFRRLGGLDGRLLHVNHQAADHRVRGWLQLLLWGRQEHPLQVARSATVFTLLRANDEIRAIKYFTTLVESESHRGRQQTFLNALGTRPLMQTILGRFKQKRIQCKCAGCTEVGDRVFEVPEEKRTDVNIAIHMLDDAYRGQCAQQVLVSGDSDLVPALQMVRRRFPAMTTIVYVPARTENRRKAFELRRAAHRHKDLPLTLLAKAQLPDRLPDGAGGFIEKPPEW